MIRSQTRNSLHRALRIVGIQCAVISAFVTVARADLTITTNTTQTGGTFTVSPAGKLIVNDASNPLFMLTGSATTSGVQEVVIGDASKGQVLVQGASVLTDNGYGFLGYSSGGNGTLTVSGSGSTWTSLLDIQIGKGGTGTVSVENGGSLQTLGTGNRLIGVSSGSHGTVTVTDAGSAWINSSILAVAESGNGTLYVVNGGIVSNTIGYIASAGPGSGTVTVADVGSTWSNSHLFIGGSGGAAGGTGSLSITNSGQVNVTGTTKLWNAGTVTLNGGTLSTGSFDRTLGTFNFYDGTLKVNGGTYTQPSGTLTVNGNTPTANPTLQLLSNGITGATSSGVTQVRIGNSNKGTLLISGGSALTNSGSGYVGYSAGSTGTATVTGTNSQWTNSGALVTGEFGNGTLNVQSGGHVSNTFGYLGDISGSVGTATVTGAGSLWTNSGAVFVGVSGNGTLNVQNGGQVSNVSAYISYLTGSTGTVTVDGLNSKWINSGDLYAGHTGNGLLNVQNSGQVSNGYGYVGRYAGSIGSVTVTAPGSTWTSSNDLYVAYEGTGTLNVQDGGQVSNGYGYVGAFSGASGTATVDGAGSTWTSSNNLYVGNHGNGTLNVQDGGHVSSGGPVSSASTIGNWPGSTGTATITGTGSTWTNSRGLTVGGAGNGTLNVQNGGHVSTSKGTIGSNGTATVTGTGSTWTTNFDNLNVNGTLNVHDGGQVSNGNAAIGSTGTVTISGPGSKWNTVGGAFIGSSGNGTLNVQNSGEVYVTNTTTLLGILKIDGGTLSTRSFDRTTFGTFDFYDGTLKVNGGTYTQPSGTLTVNGNTPTANPTLQLLSNGITGATTSGVTGVIIGGNNKGALLVSGGSVLTNSGDANIASNSGSTGTVTVDGINTNWTNTSALYVGGNFGAAGGTGSLAITGAGQVEVTGTTKLWNAGTLAMNGGTLATGTLEAATATSKIQLTGNSNTIALTSGTSTFIGGIEGSGGFIKAGAGTLILNNSNTYAGNTTVSTGTLQVSTRLANNDAAHIFIAAPDNDLTGNPILTRSVSTLLVPNNYAGLGATELGGLGTAVSLLYGTNTNGTDNAVTMQFRQRMTGELQPPFGTSPPLPSPTHAGLVSDVLNLTGMVNNVGVNAHQTDLFVLEMSYQESLLAAPESTLVGMQALYLAYFNEGTGKWTNAIEGNIGSTANLYLGDTPWTNSYTTLGQWGVNTSTNTVWAVINHNSLFAAVPEPSSLALAGMAAFGLFAIARRRRVADKARAY